MLARNAGVSVATLRRAETGSAPSETIRRVAAVLERAGIRFVEDGVQLRSTATERVEHKRCIAEILAQFDAAPDVAAAFTDANLYDENGLPG
jgi:DNA-binding LacI/PurR family transcriptional regulator